jgi:hypothetical protein
MRNQDKQAKRSKDTDELSGPLFNISTSERGSDIPLPSKAQISMLMSHLGKKGGKIGGKRRLETMTAQERTNNARLAAHARWSKLDGQK